MPAVNPTIESIKRAKELLGQTGAERPALVLAVAAEITALTNARGSTEAADDPACLNRMILEQDEEIETLTKERDDARREREALREHYESIRADGEAMIRDRDKWRSSERAVSEAYLRLRSRLPGAFDTPDAPSAEVVWSTTEAAADRLRNALEKIAAFDDVGANEHLARTGKFSRFDEPGAVKIAREAIAMRIENRPDARELRPLSEKSFIRECVKGDAEWGGRRIAPWPAACNDPNSCNRHRRCMYMGCVHQDRDIAAEIDAFAAEKKP